MTADKPDRSPQPRDLTVLIVDDEPGMRQVLERTARSMGFSCCQAGSAEAAWRVCQEHQPDLAVLDLNLPAMGGMDLFEKLRQHHRNMPVIILTGYGDLDTARRAIHLDVVDFLTKPCPLAELEQALDRARRRLPDQPRITPPEDEPPEDDPPENDPPEDEHSDNESAVDESPASDRSTSDTKGHASPGSAAPSHLDAARSADRANPAADGPDADAKKERGDDPSRALGRPLEEVERDHILAALERHDGNRQAAAKELGISVRTLYYRLQQYQQRGWL